MTTKRQTKKDYMARHQAQAAKDFEHHVIRSRDERSWMVQRPYTDEKGGWNSTFWFEVIVLRGGELYVHGDISGVHFAHYGAYKNPEEVVRWMGEKADLGYYVAQKASIGMSLPNEARSVLEVVDEGVWLDSAIDMIEKVYLDGEAFVDTVSLEPTDRIPEWLCDVVNAVIEDGIVEHEVLADLCGKNFHEAYELGVFDWGLVPSVRLIYAHEALRCLVRLLDAEHAAAAKEHQAVVSG